MTTAQILGAVLVGIPLAAVIIYIGVYVDWAAALFVIVFSVVVTAMMLGGLYLMTGSLQ